MRESLSDSALFRARRGGKSDTPAADAQRGRGAKGILTCVMIILYFIATAPLHVLRHVDAQNAERALQLRAEDSRSSTAGRPSSRGSASCSTGYS